jgi:hypothetical protein
MCNVLGLFPGTTNVIKENTYYASGKGTKKILLKVIGVFYCFASLL